MLSEFASSYFRGLEACWREVALDRLEGALQVILRAYEAGRTLFVLGNGGSASTASHLACDMGKGTAVPGQRRLRVISLVDNQALLTAWANDTSYEMVFKEQLENLLQPDDVVIAISASGNSPNVIRAVEYARERGAVTVGFVGFGGGRLRELVDLDITVSSRNYGQVEDYHLTLSHILSQYLRQRFSTTSGQSTANAAIESRAREGT
jgi:D-sedoheptulose 7-phosphate isomerase